MQESRRLARSQKEPGKWVLWQRDWRASNKGQPSLENDLREGEGAKEGESEAEGMIQATSSRPSAGQACRKMSGT